MKTFPSASYDLIATDPPYFKMELTRSRYRDKSEKTPHQNSVNEQLISIGRPN